MSSNSPLENQVTQECTRCKTFKPQSEYHPGKWGKPGHYCRPCCADYKRDRREARRPRLPDGTRRVSQHPKCVHPRPEKRLSNTYQAVHARVRKLRGLASTHACACCGTSAAHWAYDHSDPNPLRGPGGKDGRVVEYSADLDHYIPLCVPCHVRFDAPTRFGLAS